MIYTSKKFKIQELVPLSVYTQYKNNVNILWSLLDNRIILTIDMLQSEYGTAYINTYLFTSNGSQYRGWRPFNLSIGAHLSQHKFGRAVDMTFENYTAESIRNDIIQNPFKEPFIYITTLEMNIDWLHLSTQNYNKEQSGLNYIYP